MYGNKGYVEQLQALDDSARSLWAPCAPRALFIPLPCATSAWPRLRPSLQAPARPDHAGRLPWCGCVLDPSANSVRRVAGGCRSSARARRGAERGGPPGGRSWRIISHSLNSNPYPVAFLNYRATLRLAEVTLGSSTFIECAAAPRGPPSATPGDGRPVPPPL